MAASIGDRGIVPSTEAQYDTIGQAYEIAFSGNTQQLASVEWVLQELAAANGNVMSQPSRIVDIGCGTGRPVCEKFAKAGHRVLGIDISQAMIDACKRSVPNATFEKMDMREFFQREVPESFDVVTTYFAGLAGLTQSEYRSTIDEVAKLVRPGGLFVFATVPVDSDCLPMTWMGRKWIVSSLSAEDAITAVQKAGFEVVQQHTSSFLPKGEDAGLCQLEEVSEETHLFVYARKMSDHSALGTPQLSQESQSDRGSIAS